MTAFVAGILAYNIVLSLVFVVLLVYTDHRLLHLEEDSHPPINVTPAMVDVLKALRVICDRPDEGWYCSRPVGHHGACAAHWVGD